jgi:hypothetical protein
MLIEKFKVFEKKENAPAGNRTRVCTVAGYYSTTRPLVLVDYIYQIEIITHLKN